MRDVMQICNELFPQGHSVKAEGDVVFGTGTTPEGEVAVIGTRNHAAIGVDIAFALATQVLEVIDKHPGRAMLILCDTQGQQLSRRDELLGNGGYLAHLSKCFEVARQRGHLLLSLVYGEAVSGGFLAIGMIADRTYALVDAQIRVMALPAMARITQIPVERLESLCKTSAIFGPGTDNYEKLGAVEALWSDRLDAQLNAALKLPAGGDQRIALGQQRGGRLAAQKVLDTLAALG
jgi:malonate decarboxylase gamma subunit